MAPWQSGLKALVGLAVVEQVPDPIHSVLEQGGGCKHEHPRLWIDKWDGSKSGNEPGDFLRIQFPN